VGGPKAGYMYRWWYGTLITIVKAVHEHQNPTITYCAAFWSLSISVTVPSCSFWSKTSYPAGGTLFPLITTITKVHEDEGLKNNLTDIRISEYDVFTNSSSAFWKWRSSRINGWMGLAEDVYKPVLFHRNKPQVTHVLLTEYSLFPFEECRFCHNLHLGTCIIESAAPWCRRRDAVVANHRMAC
jgi:hypothetical protein